MFKRIEIESNEVIEGFSYQENDGELEYVIMDYSGRCHSVDIKNSGEDVTTIYKADIPKLILALQAAYDFKGN